MSEAEYQSILGKARDYALDGDYQSAYSHYEEVKKVIESRGLRFESPAVKRVCHSNIVLIRRILISVRGRWMRSPLFSRKSKDCNKHIVIAKVTVNYLQLGMGITNMNENVDLRPDHPFQFNSMI